jgi:hypothetical protein
MKRSVHFHRRIRATPHTSFDPLPVVRSPAGRSGGDVPFRKNCAPYHEMRARRSLPPRAVNRPSIGQAGEKKLSSKKKTNLKQNSLNGCRTKRLRCAQLGLI